MCLLWLLIVWLLLRIDQAVKIGKIELLRCMGIFTCLLLSALSKEHTVVLMAGLFIGFSTVGLFARQKDRLAAKKALILAGTALASLLIYAPLLIAKINTGSQHSYHYSYFNFDTGLILNILLNITKYIYYYSLLMILFFGLTFLLIVRILARRESRSFLFTIPLWFGAAAMIMFLIIYPRSRLFYPFPIYAIVLPIALACMDGLRTHFSSVQKIRCKLATVFLLLLLYNGTAQAFNWALYNKLNAHSFTSYLNWSNDNLPKNAKLYIFNSDRGTWVERYISLNF